MSNETVVCEDRLAMVKGVHLTVGKGAGIVPNDPAHCTVCIEQLANAIACSMQGESLVPFYALDKLDDLSDDNPSVCRVIRALRIRINDRCPDAVRDEILMPTLLLAFNTRGSDALTWRRTFRVLDWTIREVLPDVFDRAKLAEHASNLRALAPITDKQTLYAYAYAYAAAAAAAAAYAAARNEAWRQFTPLLLELCEMREAQS